MKSNTNQPTLTLEFSARPEPFRLQKQPFEFVGRHFLSSYMGCSPAALTNAKALVAALVKAVEAAGATLLNLSQHHFPEGGMTAVLLLSESHASIHTYPEYSACFVDLFTCGESCDPVRFDNILKTYLKPTETTSRILLRHQGIEDAPY